jgi:diguanylate cyclase (GGDEF)-like protein
MSHSLRRYLLCILCLAGVHAVWLLASTAPKAVFVAVNDLASVGFGTLAAGGVIATALRTRGAGRTGIWLIAGFLTAFTAGDLLWAHYELVRHENPFPSWADAGYLTSYPLLATGLLLLPRSPLSALQRGRVLLDALTLLTAVLTFSWYCILGPTVLSGDVAPSLRLLSAGYPLGDLTVLACLVALTMAPRQKEARAGHRLIGCGMLMFITADTTQSWTALHGLDLRDYPAAFLGWIVGNQLIAIGARAAIEARVSVTPASMQEDPPPSVGKLLLPYSLVPAVGTLVIGLRISAGDSRLHIGVLIGAGLLVSVLVLRQVAVLLESRDLTTRLQAALTALERHNERLEALATMDSMTGLVNHGSFQERLRQEMERALRRNRPTALLFVDVDHFKGYNDLFGHPAGDIVLKTVADLLTRSVRVSDLVARYGGEEFAVLLPETDIDLAKTIAQRICTGIAEHAFEHRTVTVSIGLATASVSRIESKELIAWADRALYAAKDAGRNGVAVWTSEIVSLSDAA